MLKERKAERKRELTVERTKPKQETEDVHFSWNTPTGLQAAALKSSKRFEDINLWWDTRREKDTRRVS